METRNVFNAHIIIITFVFNCSTIWGQCSEVIYIEANVSDEIHLNESYFEKKVSQREIVYSFGLETLGEINEFTHDRIDNKVLNLSQTEYKSLKFSTIRELNNILQKKNKLKSPDSVFKLIFIVEKETMNKIIAYQVSWRKLIYTE